MISEKELYELYVNKDLTSNQISEKLGVCRATVLHYLSKYKNIPKRKPGQRMGNKSTNWK